MGDGWAHHDVLGMRPNAGPFFALATALGAIPYANAVPTENTNDDDQLREIPLQYASITRDGKIALVRWYQTVNAAHRELAYKMPEKELNQWYSFARHHLGHDVAGIFGNAELNDDEIAAGLRELQNRADEYSRGRFGGNVIKSFAILMKAKEDWMIPPAFEEEVINPAGDEVGPVPPAKAGAYTGAQEPDIGDAQDAAGTNDGTLNSWRMQQRLMNLQRSKPDTTMEDLLKMDAEQQATPSTFHSEKYIYDEQGRPSLRNNGTTIYPTSGHSPNGYSGGDGAPAGPQQGSADATAPDSQRVDQEITDTGMGPVRIYNPFDLFKSYFMGKESTARDTDSGPHSSLDHDGKKEPMPMSTEHLGPAAAASGPGSAGGRPTHASLGPRLLPYEQSLRATASAKRKRPRWHHPYKII